LFVDRLIITLSINIYFPAVKSINMWITPSFTKSITSATEKRYTMEFDLAPAQEPSNEIVGNFCTAEETSH
jgi:hypothetical protein